MVRKVYPLRRPRLCALGAALSLSLLLPIARAAEAAAVTLPQALEAALTRRPELAAFTMEFQAAEGRVLQSNLRPNPELEFEVGNLAEETALGVSQVLETGGKRRARIRSAEAGLPVLRADLQRLRRDVAADVRRAFVALLGAQERLTFKREALDLAARLTETVSERVKAGAVSPIEETRARVALATTTAELARAQRELTDGRFALAAAVGGTVSEIEAAAGDLSANLSVPSWDVLAERALASPDLDRWEKERARREAALGLEHALAAQDVSLKGSFTYNRTDETGLLAVGVSIPLPLFNKNQGAIREAEADLTKTAQERRITEADVLSRLARSYEAVSASAREAKLLQEEALVGAQQAYDAVNEGYRLGKFRYLDVLDAGNALLQAKLQHLEALVTLNLARADLERLAGEPFPPVTEPAKP